LAGLGGGDNTSQRNLAAWLYRFTPRYAGLSVQAGGPAEAGRELTLQSRHDLLKAEAISVPVVTLILFLVFRGMLASLLPLMTAGITTIGTLALLRLLTMVTTVSLYASNLTTGLALGLGVDYSLLLVSRYREERAAGFDADEAVRRSWRTAGRTVAFSAATVALALTSLFLFPIPLLTSIAFAGIGVVVLAATSSLLVLPAVLRLLGDRFDRRSWARRVIPVEHERWYRIAAGITRRPLRYALGVVVLLLCLGAPSLHAHLALPSAQVLPRRMESVQVAATLTRDFPDRPDTWAYEQLSATRGRTLDQADLTQYLVQLSKVAGTSIVIGSDGTFQAGRKVQSPAPAPAVRGEGTWVELVPDARGGGVAWLSGLRAVPSPFVVRFAGPAAVLADTLDELASGLPYALALVSLSVLMLLWLLTGSVLLPIKALVLNGFTLCAMLGACVVVIQEGHARALLGSFTVTGSMSACIPVLMFVLAFGLSMDYEVFLLARIYEEHRRGYSDREAVARGLGRTGRLVTAAAILLALVFAAFISSGVTDLKLLGFGLAFAVLLDATLVRGVLVPALVTLAGRWNWWAPAPLVRLHRRVGITENGREVAGESGPGPPDHRRAVAGGGGRPGSSHRADDEPAARGPGSGSDRGAGHHRPGRHRRRGLRQQETRHGV
jgi:putative drug exporter of the RND superfamily